MNLAWRYNEGVKLTTPCGVAAYTRGVMHTNRTEWKL
jgi:hypothetical protein